MESYIGKIQSPHKENETIDSVRLHLNNNNIEVEFNSNGGRFDNIKILIGIFNGLGKVTLVNCQNIGVSVGAGGYIRKYNAEYLLIGDFLNDLDSCFFKKVTVLMNGLLDWTKISSVKNNLFIDKKLEIKEIESIEIYKSNDISIELFPSYRINLKRENNLITISENTGFRIKSLKENINIWSYLSLITELKKFFFLIGNLSTHTERTNFFIDKEEPITLFWSGNNSVGSTSYSSPKIKFEQIKHNLNEIIHNWFEKKDLQTSVDLILEKTSNNNLSIENFFLNNCFSIETFHRRFRNYKLFQKSEFKEIKEKLFSNNLDKDIKKLIESSLAHINEPNFRNRLNDFKSEFDVLLPNEWIADDYINRIVKTRNYLVHRSSKKNVFDEFEMKFAAMFIESIVKVNIFRTLGIEENIIDELLIDSGKKIRSSYNSNKKTTEI